MVSVSFSKTPGASSVDGGFLLGKVFYRKALYPKNFFRPNFGLDTTKGGVYNYSMSYDITTPIVVGLFSLTTTILIVYFFWLFSVLKTHPKRDFVIVATISMFIMIIGLLLTGVEW